MHSRPEFNSKFYLTNFFFVFTLFILTTCLFTINSDNFQGDWLTLSFP